MRTIKRYRAHDWFAEQKPDGWATCPTTENGFVRVLTHPKYSSPLHRPAELLTRLRAFRESGGHHFLARCGLSDLRDDLQCQLIRGHRQVTDVYLLGLAKSAGGRLATFDRTIPVTALRGAGTSTLLVIAPDVIALATPGELRPDYQIAIEAAMMPTQPSSSSKDCPFKC